MNKVTLKEYVNERIADIKHYIEFNERKNDKDFFAHKELELYQNAQKYIELTDELGCPLEVVFKALKQKHIFVEEAYCCEAGEVYKLEDKKLGYVNIDLSIQFTAVEKIDDYFKEFANRWCWQFQYNIDHNVYGWDWYLVTLKDYKKTWWLSKTKEE